MHSSTFFQASRALFNSLRGVLGEKCVFGAACVVTLAIPSVAVTAPLLSAQTLFTSIQALTSQSCVGMRYADDRCCTSNDFNAIAQFFQSPGGITECVGGETSSVDLYATPQRAPPTRYDVATFFGEQGNAA